MVMVRGSGGGRVVVVLLTSRYFNKYGIEIFLIIESTKNLNMLNFRNNNSATRTEPGNPRARILGLRRAPLRHYFKNSRRHRCVAGF